MAKKRASKKHTEDVVIEQQTEEAVEIVTEDDVEEIEEPQVKEPEATIEETVDEQVEESIEEAPAFEQSDEVIQEPIYVEETPTIKFEEKAEAKTIEEEIKINKQILNKKQRMFIFNLISNGYTIKDILANIKYKLNLTNEEFNIISKNVRSIRDLLNNIGVDV